MGKQSSRMYGIKVKERVNYYEFGANDGYITLYYIENLDIWQVKAGKHNQSSANDIEWWHNGHSYNAGDTIESFNDGDIVTLHILESHIDTTPYTNYMYDIFGNASENVQYGNKDVKYSIMPGKSTYSCKVTYFENGMIKSSKEFDSEDIRRFKEIQPNDLYPVYNMKFDWHGMNPQSGYPQMSFQAISNSDYIKYNNNTISKGETIRTFQAAGFTGFEVVDDTNKYTAQNKSKDAVPSIHLCKRIGGSQICAANKDKKSIFSEIFYDHKEAYYNGHYHKAMYLVYDNPGVADCWKKGIGSLSITYAKPYWFLMANKAGVQYGGRTYEARKLIRSWLPSDSVNMTLKEITSRKKENAKDYNKMVYDITKQANVDSITVIWQEVVETKDEEGHTIRQYVDLDTITFASSDSPVTFHNLQYRFNTTKWTIISKCGYIKYDGKTYVENRAVLSFNLDEDVHIEITDETNKYYVQTETTYIVKTPSSDITVGYELHTAEGSYTMKIVKTNGADEEPWVTVNFYDAIYRPFEYDDISLRFDTTEMKWELYSNSDNLYYNGTSYSKGSKLGEWAYKQIVRIGNIIVTHEDHDALQVIKRELTDGKLLKNNDIDQDFAWHDSESVDFHLSYSYAKGLWTIKAVHDCWHEGIKYTEGQIIKQFKTRVFLDPFSILCAYQDDPESPVLTNVLYSFNINIDIDGVTTITVSSDGHNSESYSDKDISHGAETILTFTTKDATSMYGYIWEKSTPPGPTPGPDMYRYYFVPVLIPTSNDYGIAGNGYRYIAAIRIEPGHRYVKKLAYNGYYNRINFPDEFEVISNELMFHINYVSGKANYRYYSTWSNGPLNTNNWSFVDSFPNSTGSLVIFYAKNNKKITFTFKRYYEDEDGEGWRIIKREYTDNYMGWYVETITEHFYPDWDGFPWIDHKCNLYFNGEQHLYSNMEGIVQYIDKGDYLLLFSNACLIESGNSQRCISAKLNVETGEMTSFNNQIPIDIQAIRSDAISRGMPNSNRTTADLSSCKMTVGKYQLYYVKVISDGWSYSVPSQDRFAMYYVYKYDVEENTITFKGSYKIYPIVITGNDESFNDNRLYDTPWHIPDVLSDGKGYSYIKSSYNNKLEVYEIEDPYDFEEIYSGGTKVAEYDLDNTINILNLGTNEYSQFAYSTLFRDLQYDRNASGVSKCEYYDTISNMFLGKNSKKGMFRYVFNKTNNVEPMIIYFPDPTLESVSGAFFFKTSSLRYSNELNEEWFINT